MTIDDRRLAPPVVIVELAVGCGSGSCCRGIGGGVGSWLAEDEHASKHTSQYVTVRK